MQFGGGSGGEAGWTHDAWSPSGWPPSAFINFKSGMLAALTGTLKTKVFQLAMCEYITGGNGVETRLILMWESVTLTLRECSVKVASCCGGGGRSSRTTSPEPGDARGLDFLLRNSCWGVSLTGWKNRHWNSHQTEAVGPNAEPTMNHWWDFIHGRWLAGSPALHPSSHFSPIHCVADKQWGVSDPWLQAAGTAPSASSN